MTDPVESFIARWQGVTASELATAQSFVIGLCRLLDLPEPHATAEQAIYDKGLVAVLKSLHDDLDAAVLDAYGWHDQPADEQILERLVALNTERAAEEAQGHVRWLRPEFQNPRGTTQAGLGVSQVTICDSHEEPATPPATQAWPQTLPEQIAALANALTPAPQTEAELAARFAGKGKWKARLPELLATLATLGHARRLDDGRWMG